MQLLKAKAVYNKLWWLCWSKLITSFFPVSVELLLELLMGFRIRFKVAVFFSPFLAAIINQIMLGSNDSALMRTKALVPIKEAAAVKRGHKMNS